MITLKKLICHFCSCDYNLSSGSANEIIPANSELVVKVSVILSG